MKYSRKIGGVDRSPGCGAPVRKYGVRAPKRPVSRIVVRDEEFGFAHEVLSCGHVGDSACWSTLEERAEMMGRIGERRTCFECQGTLIAATVSKVS